MIILSHVKRFRAPLANRLLQGVVLLVALVFTFLIALAKSRLGRVSDSGELGVIC